MHPTRSALALASILAVAMLATLAPAMRRAPDRIVTVTVSVRAATNEPVEGLCIAVSFDRPGSPILVESGRTGASGIASVQIRLPEGAQRLVILPSPIAKGCESFEGVRTFQTAMRDNYIEPWKGVTVANEATTCSAEFQGEKATRVVGVLPHTPGEVVSGSIFAGRHFAIAAKPNRDSGEFALPGLPKGRASDIFISRQSEQYTVIPVTPGPDESEVNLGTIILATHGQVVSFKAQVNRRTEVSPQPAVTDSHVTLVRIDGGDVWAFPIDASGKAHRRDQPHEPPRLPLGTYFALPGRPSGNHLGIGWLVRLAREGKRAELEAAGLPILKVTEDGQGAIQFDGPDAERAVAKLAGYG